MSAGKMIETGRPLDLAINGPGYFQMRVGDRILYSRAGSFSRAADGNMVTPQGYVLQQSGGGDLTLPSEAATVSVDGTVLDGDRPVGQIAVFLSGKNSAQVLDGSLFSMSDGSAEEVAKPSVRTGALEASNVTVGDEMIGTMGGMRDAETGAKLIQVYDDLMGRVIQTFGQAR